MIFGKKGVKWIFISALTALLCACESGSNALHIGIFGGRHNQVGAGVNFPINTTTPIKQEHFTYQTAIEFQVGDLLIQNDLYYRRYLGVAPNGGYVVQDFYKADNGSYELLAPEDGGYADRKLTDAYVLTDKDALENNLFAGILHNEDQKISADAMTWVTNVQAHGVFVVWFKNGQKALQGTFENMQLDGSWLQWYTNGNKHIAGAYSKGQSVGRWSTWSLDGQRMFSVNRSLKEGEEEQEDMPDDDFFMEPQNGLENDNK